MKQFVVFFSPASWERFPKNQFGWDRVKQIDFLFSLKSVKVEIVIK
jgi:hypothetical protein